MFGLAIRISIEASPGKQKVARLEMLEDFLKASRDAMFKVIDWILKKFVEITAWFCY